MNQNSFTPLKNISISEIECFYTTLNQPLADLNAIMMFAWQSVLDLHYYLSNDGILYMVAYYEGEYYGWGPPLGHSVSLMHIDTLLNFLNKMNKRPSSILYLWDKYPLFEYLFESPIYLISEQASEYIYKSDIIASLPMSTMKSLHKKREYFKRRFNPATKIYSHDLCNDCLIVLKKWLEQKKKVVSLEYMEKLLLEAEVCHYAIKDQLPLSGVVVYIDGIPEGFSLGGNHTKDCFNCMFEKTNLSINGLSVVIFSELAKEFKNMYPMINAGEDWGISYLRETKMKWNPSIIQKSYKLSRAI